LTTIDISKECLINYSVKKLISNTSWIFFEKIFRMILNFVVFAAIARHLGASDFGILSYCLSLLYFLTPLWSLGTDHVFKQKFIIGQEDSPSENLISTFTILRIFTSLALFVLVIAFSHLFLNQLNYILLIIISSSLFFRSIESIEVFNNSQLNSKYNTYSKTISFVIISVINLTAISLSAPLIFFAFSYALEFLIYACLQLIIFRRGNIPLKLHFDKKEALLITKKSFPIFASTCCSVVFFKIDHLFLGNMIGMEAVGQYAAAVRLSEIWYFIPASIMISLFSPVQSYFVKDKEKYYELLRKIYSGFFYFSIVISLFISVTSDFWVDIIFKERYENTAAILSIHIWSFVFVAWGFAQEPWDVANNLLKLRFKRLAVGALCNITLCLILIPTYGVLGAAYATLISRATAYFFINLHSKESREIFSIQLSSIFYPIKYLHSLPNKKQELRNA
jgi:PST family polysaccharide transporter